jgi:hypothetical protein
MARRAVAIAAIAVLLSFAFASVAHWHSGLHEDQQCRLCHFAHAPALDWSHAASLPAPATARTAKALASLDPQLELVFHHTSPRAPPRASQLA